MTTVLRRLFAAMLVPLLLVLTSCMRVQQTFEIKSKDRVDVVLNYAVAKTMANVGSSPVTLDNVCEGGGSAQQANKPQIELQDEKKEPYDDGSYIGCKMSGWVKPGDLGSGVVIALADGVWTFKLDGAASSSGSTEFNKLVSDFKVQVTFPGKVLTHNGSSTVDGTTVTWTNANDLGAGLEATGEAKDGLPVWLWAVLGLLVIAGVGGGVWYWLQSRKKSAAAGWGASGPYGPMGGPAPMSAPGYGPDAGPMGYDPNGGRGAPQGFGAAQDQGVGQSFGAPQGFGAPGSFSGNAGYGNYGPGEGLGGVDPWSQSASQPSANPPASGPSAPYSQPSAPQQWGGPAQNPGQWNQPNPPQGGWPQG